MRVVNTLLAILFVVLAATHTQVSDAWQWVLLFGIMAILSVMAIFELYFAKVLVVLLVGLSAWCYFLFAEMNQSANPESYDFLFSPVAKVFFCVVVLIVFLYCSWRYALKRQEKQNGETKK
ncbi:MAG: hypothetical protein KF845_11825 [Cyclobacteriaceae bacterium]|nr:hypothetical protein [Cyclobacteriaceae bacterium]